MSEPKRLHPVAAVSHSLRTLKEAILPIIIFFVFGGNRDSKWDFIELYLAPVVLITIFALGVLSWMRFTYRIEEGELRLESGVFIRKKRYIRFERIQSIDVSEGILQRLFGLVQLKVETAGSSGADQADAVLSAITKQEADEIMLVLSEEKKRRLMDLNDIDEADGESEREIPHRVFQMPFKELFLMAATSGGVGVVFSGAMAFFSQFEEMIPYKRIFKGLGQFVQTGILFIILAVIAGLLIAYIIATAGIVMKYAFFTVKKTEDELIISRGLMERRQLTIPLKKIQGIRITENIIRQPLGFASVIVEYAGGSVMDKENSQVMLFPLIKKGRVALLLKEFVPEFETGEGMAELPQRAFLRYLFRQWIIVLPVVAGCLLFLRPWGYAAILLLPLSAGWAYLCYRSGGWSITGDQLLLRYRFLSQETLFVKKRRIQVLESNNSWFQGRKQLATISATIKSGLGPRAGRVVDLELQDAEDIKQWFSLKR
ncbi:hypothetical protein D0469_15065 [Peribacillus saganii]|uniref:YdbS-like PH domain-containing protein n=1 Tax=Peribacillus saganii TaxID=2303992 RepID=A0A372LKV0_9BACI|nr:PH domain-containing protein [Peribacillus saganii]RFU67389.1 hypothetical protein D0469_15065 [Peribacillus saganii]